MLLIVTFEPVERIKALWVVVVRYLSRRRFDKLVASTPLIDGYQHIELSYHELHDIHKAFKRCQILGHIWEIDSIQSGLPYTYISKCASCFPHIRSQHTVQSYNLFAISERDED